MKIAFDIDDTLIIPSVVTGTENKPHEEHVALYKAFQSLGCQMILWSGSGQDWCRKWNNEIGLEADEIREKKYYNDIDICFDDMNVELAKTNVRVARIKNSISRAEWNKNKK